MLSPHLQRLTFRHLVLYREKQRGCRGPRGTGDLRCLCVRGRGHYVAIIHEDFTKRTLRFWTLVYYPNYTIVYRPDRKPLEIIAVLHGKRNIRRVLAKRP